MSYFDDDDYDISESDFYSEEGQDLDEDIDSTIDYEPEDSEETEEQTYGEYIESQIDLDYVRYSRGPIPFAFQTKDFIPCRWVELNEKDLKIIQKQLDIYPNSSWKSCAFGRKVEKWCAMHMRSLGYQVRDLNENIIGNVFPPYDLEIIHDFQLFKIDVKGKSLLHSGRNYIHLKKFHDASYAIYSFQGNRTPFYFAFEGFLPLESINYLKSRGQEVFNFDLQKIYLLKEVPHKWTFTSKFKEEVICLRKICGSHPDVIWPAVAYNYFLKNFRYLDDDHYKALKLIFDFYQVNSKEMLLSELLEISKRRKAA